MSNFPGPLEYLVAFAIVLAAGLLFGFGLGWHWRGLSQQRRA
jgi:hypothetical protein